jgi:hypothetical protein
MAKKKFNPNNITSLEEAKHFVGLIYPNGTKKTVYVSSKGYLYTNKEVAIKRSGENELYTIKLK